jgi:hypothetical protein
LATVAWAQPTVETVADEVTSRHDERLGVSLLYGGAIRTGSETDLGPGLSYTGFAPNDVSLSGAGFFLLDDRVGLKAHFRREAFGLYDGNARVTQGSLFRASLGPTGRYRIGPARLEGSVSYAFQQLPTFGTVQAPALVASSRHAVLLAARGLVEFGPAQIDVRLDAPISFAHSGLVKSSSGFGLGGGVRMQLLRFGNLDWGVAADALWSQDTMAGDDTKATQSVVRVGLAIDVQWRESSDRRHDADLHVLVMADGQPKPGASVSLSSTGPVATTGADGLAIFSKLEPSSFTCSVTAEGFEPSDVRVSLSSATRTNVSIPLSKEAPKVGAARIRVVAKEDGRPLQAKVVVGGTPKETGLDGVVMFEGLAPGPMEVQAGADDFQPAQEALSVVAGSTSHLKVELIPIAKRVPATLSGHIRSAKGGAPIAAALEIVELKQTLKADEAGAFVVLIPGGTYVITIAAPGFATQTKSVTVRDGDQAIFNVDLFPK